MSTPKNFNKSSSSMKKIGSCQKNVISGKQIIKGSPDRRRAATVPDLSPFRRRVEEQKVVKESYQYQSADNSPQKLENQADFLFAVHQRELELQFLLHNITNLYRKYKLRSKELKNNVDQLEIQVSVLKDLQTREIQRCTDLTKVNEAQINEIIKLKQYLDNNKKDVVVLQELMLEHNQGVNKYIEDMVFAKHKIYYQMSQNESQMLSCEDGLQQVLVLVKDCSKNHEKDGAIIQFLKARNTIIEINYNRSKIKIRKLQDIVRDLTECKKNDEKKNKELKDKYEGAEALIAALNAEILDAKHQATLLLNNKIDIIKPSSLSWVYRLMGRLCVVFSRPIEWLFH